MALDEPTRLRIAARVEELLLDAPPLTAAQRERLRTLLASETTTTVTAVVALPRAA